MNIEDKLGSGYASGTGYRIGSGSGSGFASGFGYVDKSGDGSGIVKSLEGLEKHEDGYGYRTWYPASGCCSRSGIGRG